jgi:flavin-binding protein dodecin
MAKKKQSESVYRIIDVVGVSEESWEDAGRKGSRDRCEFTA